MLNQDAFRIHPFAKRFGEIDLEALKFVVLVDEVEGRIGAFHGDADRRRRGRFLSNSRQSCRGPADQQQT